MPRTIGLLCSCVMLALACRPPGGAVATYRSPDGVYAVKLTGQSTAPKAMFVEQRVYASAFKRERSVVRDWEVHFADMLDTAFDDAYLAADWIHPNVLRFRNSGINRDVAPDVIVIENHGHHGLSFVTVKAEDLFLAFDLAAGSTMRLMAPAQAAVGDLSWVKVEGQWEGGRKLPAASMNFVLPKHVRGPFHYVAEITDTGTQIREIQQGALSYR